MSSRMRIMWISLDVFGTGNLLTAFTLAGDIPKPTPAPLDQDINRGAISYEIHIFQSGQNYFSDIQHKFHMVTMTFLMYRKYQYIFKKYSMTYQSKTLCGMKHLPLSDDLCPIAYPKRHYQICKQAPWLLWGARKKRLVAPPTIGWNDGHGPHKGVFCLIRCTCCEGVVGTRCSKNTPLFGPSPDLHPHVGGATSLFFRAPHCKHVQVVVKTRKTFFLNCANNI